MLCYVTHIHTTHSHNNNALKYITREEFTHIA